MARLIIGGIPGSRYTNTTGKVLYQLIVQFDYSCGVCISYANKVGDSWPIPFHRGCRCTQRPIYPGQTSEPFLDFRDEIRKLDVAQQNRVMGAANYRLVESGVVKYEDVVTERRVRNLREVVARQKLTVDQMTRAGVPKRTASEAYNAVHTNTHTATEQRRQQLVDNLMSRGYTGDQIRQYAGQSLASRLSMTDYSNRPKPSPPTPPVPKPKNPPPDSTGGMVPAGPRGPKPPTLPTIIAPIIAGKVAPAAHYATLEVAKAVTVALADERFREFAKAVNELAGLNLSDEELDDPLLIALLAWRYGLRFPWMID